MCLNFRQTDAGEVIAFLKHHGVRLQTDDPGMINLFTDLSGGLLINDYESGFMSDKERRVLGGNLQIAGSTNGGWANSLSFAKHFLHHPLLGHRKRSEESKRKLQYVLQSVF